MKDKVSTKLSKLTEKPKRPKTQRFREEIQDVEFQEITPKKSDTDNLIFAYAFFHYSGKAVVLPALVLTFIGFVFGRVPLEVLATVGIVLILWAFGTGVTLYQLEKGGRK